MLHRRLVAPAVAAAALVLAGCEGNVIVDDWPTFTVEGLVVTAGGSPVRDAQVELRMYDQGCTGERERYLGGHRTDSRGRFDSRFDDGRGILDVCFVARITPPPASSLPEATVTVDSVHASVGSRGEADIGVTFVLP